MDWSHLYKKYKGLWVALESDERTVIVSGKTPGEVLEKAQAKGYPKPYLNYVPKKLLPFIG